MFSQAKYITSATFPLYFFRATTRCSALLPIDPFSKRKYITSATFPLYFFRATTRCSALLPIDPFSKRKPVAVRTTPAASSAQRRRARSRYLRQLSARSGAERAEHVFASLPPPTVVRNRCRGCLRETLTLLYVRMVTAILTMRNLPAKVQWTRARGKLSWFGPTRPAPRSSSILKTTPPRATKMVINHPGSIA